MEFSLLKQFNLMSDVCSF